MVPTKVMEDALLETVAAFAKAANRILEESRRLKTSNKVKLQHAVYRQIREDYGLSANLAIRAIARVAYAVKIAAKKRKIVKEFHPTSVDYDSRIFDFREKDETVSLTTLKGRIHIPLKIGMYQRDLLKGTKPTCAKVVRNGKDWDIHIVIEEAEPPKRGGPPLGIDFGIKNIASFSTGNKISGSRIQAIKDRYRRIRASLQSKGSRGAKKVLTRLSGRERRFISWANHNVAKDAVRLAVKGGFGTIRMEDLKGIRGRTKTRSKHLNRMISGWSFGELHEFIRYKAVLAGIETENVNPAWTSQTCHKCKNHGERDGENFSCTTCGWTGYADVNAACNIAAGGVEAGETPASCNATRIVDFFQHRIQTKAAGL